MSTFSLSNLMEMQIYSADLRGFNFYLFVTFSTITSLKQKSDGISDDSNDGVSWFFTFTLVKRVGIAFFLHSHFLRIHSKFFRFFCR